MRARVRRAQETSFSGYTGSSYLRWDGPDYFQTPGHGIFEFEFEVEVNPLTSSLFKVCQVVDGL